MLICLALGFGTRMSCSFDLIISDFFYILFEGYSIHLHITSNSLNLATILNHFMEISLHCATAENTFITRTLIISCHYALEEKMKSGYIARIYRPHRSYFGYNFLSVLTPIGFSIVHPCYELCKISSLTYCTVSGKFCFHQTMEKSTHFQFLRSYTKQIACKKLFNSKFAT